MKPTEYLDKAKIALAVQTDYALAKQLEIPTQRIAEYYKGKAWPDAYACAKIGLALKMDPLEVLADVESQREKKESRREFWRGFIGRSKKAAAVLLLGWCFGNISMSAQGGGSVAAMMAASAAGWLWLNRRLRIMYIM